MELRVLRYFWRGARGNHFRRADAMHVRGLVDFGIFIEPADLSKYDFIKLPVTDIWGDAHA